MRNLTFGSDPEVFVKKNDEVVPAFNFLPSRDARKKVSKNNVFDDYASDSKFPYWDGFQAEFSTGVHTCRDELTSSVWTGMKSILDKAPAGSEIDIRSVVTIPPDILKSVSDNHAALGCDPSMNIYGPEPILIKDARRLKYRFAGHHFHFGVPNAKELHATPELVINIMQNLDATIGLMGVSLFENLDDPVRRKYYGRAGEFRLPKHGLEYRTLSSSVLVHPAIHHLLWDVGGRVVRLSLEKHYGTQYELPKKYPNEIVDISVVKDAINNYKADVARELLVDCRDYLNHIFEMAYGYDPKIQEFAWKTFLQPAEKTVNTDVTSNWNLNTYFYYEKARFSALAESGYDYEDCNFDDDRWLGPAEDDDYDW